MTTQELKNNIEKVLGNSIRCLLPSYWWKKLFHSVADRIDEVEQKIDGIDIPGVPIVNSESELNKLNIPKGSIASVTSDGMKFSQCYYPTEDELKDISSVWDKLTRVKSIEAKRGLMQDGEAVIAELWNKDRTEYVLLTGTNIDGFDQFVAQTNYGGMYIFTGRSTLVNNSLNDFLSQNDFRYYPFTFDNIQMLEALGMIFSINSTSDVYTKGASWEKLAKESDITGEGGNTSVDGLTFGKERYAYVSRYKDANGNISETSLTNEQRAYNQETQRMLTLGEKVYLSHGGTFWTLVSYSSSTSFFSTAFMQNPHEDKVSGMVMTLSSNGYIELIEHLVGGSSNDITVDSALSNSSTNPVQNKTIYSELQKKQDMISDLADIRSGAALCKTALQQDDIADLATKDDITNLTNEIITNEEVHAAALNDLNERINNIGGGNGGGSASGGGVLRVWINEENTHEQIAENVATYNAIMNEAPTSVVLAIKDQYVSDMYSVSLYETDSGDVGLLHSSRLFYDNSLTEINMMVRLSSDGSTEIIDS